MRDDDEICKNREDVRRCLHRTFPRWKKNRVSKSVRWLAVACGGQPRCGSCGGVSDGFDGFAGAFNVGGEVGSEDAEGLDGGGAAVASLTIFRLAMMVVFAAAMASSAVFLAFSAASMAKAEYSWFLASFRSCCSPGSVSSRRRSSMRVVPLRARAASKAARWRWMRSCQFG